jgi:hypothetical protein
MFNWIPLKYRVKKTIYLLDKLPKDPKIDFLMDELKKKIAFFDEILQEHPSSLSIVPEVVELDETITDLEQHLIFILSNSVSEGGNPSQFEIKKRRDRVELLVGKGLNDREISDNLGVSESTIKQDRLARGIRYRKR